MSTKLETTQFPTVTVQKREFPIGPLSLYQIAKLTHLLSSVARQAMVRQAQRNAEIAKQAQIAAGNAREDLRQLLAERNHVTPDEIKEPELAEAVGQFFLDKRAELITASGYDGYVGLFFEFLETLSEHQLVELARIVLERQQSQNVTLDFVREHFAPVWFLEAVTLFVEQNDIPGIIKNSQRLIASISTQYQMSGQASAQPTSNT